MINFGLCDGLNLWFRNWNLKWMNVLVELGTLKKLLVVFNFNILRFSIISKRWWQRSFSTFLTEWFLIYVKIHSWWIDILHPQWFPILLVGLFSNALTFVLMCQEVTLLGKLAVAVAVKAVVGFDRWVDLSMWSIITTLIKRLPTYFAPVIFIFQQFFVNFWDGHTITRHILHSWYICDIFRDFRFQYYIRLRNQIFLEIML